MNARSAQSRSERTLHSTPNGRSAILATRIYAPEGGAAPYRLAALVAALKRSGCETLVLTTQPPEKIAGTRDIRRWPVLRNSAGSVRGYVQYASFDIPLFFRLLFAKKPRVVIVEPPPTTGVVSRIACRLRRVPYVYFSADVATSAARGIGVNPILLAILRRVELWVLNGAARVLTVSEHMRDELVELGAHPDHITVVGAGIDTDRFSVHGPVASADYPYLVYAGTMSEIQGSGVFVEAFGRIAREHPTARLKMFGSGVELEKLRARAEKLAPGQVDFPGLISGDEVASWLRGAHAGLASIRPDRGSDFTYATKALASISCGTPVIFAGVGPTFSVIEDNELGWAADWDADQVAVAMDAALNADRSDADRERLSGWVEQHYSVRTFGDTAVAAIFPSRH